MGYKSEYNDVSEQSASAKRTITNCAGFPSWIPDWIVYAITALSVSIITILLSILEPYIPLTRFIFPYILTIFVITYMFGLYPGLFCFVISIIVYTGLFLYPRYFLSSLFAESPGFTNIIAFIIGSVMAIAIAIVIRRSRFRVAQLAEELMESGSNYRNLLESITDAFFALDRNWNFTYINKQAEQILSISSKDVLGKYYWNIFPTAQDSEFYRQYHKVMNERTPVTFDAYYKPLNLWAEIHAYPYATGISVFLRDITRRKQMEDALRESEGQYHLLYETMLQGVVYQDSDGKILSMNPAAIKILGKTPEEFLGQTSKSVEYDTMREDGSIFPGEEHPAMVALRTGTEISNVEMGVYNPREKRYRWINVSAVPLFRDNQNEPYQVYTIFNDITEQKHVEAERLRLLNEARQHAAELDAIFNSLDEGVEFWNKSGDLISINQAGMKIFNFTDVNDAKRIMPEYKSRIEAFYPDMSEMPYEDWPVKRLQRGENVSGLINVIKFPITGEIKWLRNTGAVVKDASGNPIIFMLAFRDITDEIEAKEKEQELERHKTEFYQHTIMAATGGKLIITDINHICGMLGDPVRVWEINEPGDIARIRHDVISYAESAGMESERTSKFGVCVSEAITNVLKHAGSGFTSLHSISDKLIFISSDKGAGIDAINLPEVALTRGYSTAGTLGMGYKIMISFADKVYLSTGPEGTIVAIEMKLHADDAQLFPDISLNIPDNAE